jgi:hypothetical protein
MATVLGQTFTEFTRDNAGNRTYQVTTLVKADPTDGPYTILSATGLPAEGDVWKFNSEQDVWATCTSDCRISPFQRGDDSAQYYTVTNTFSTKAPEANRCQQQAITDPLLTPAEISGSFVTSHEEIQFDRFGNAIKTSSHERIRGPQVQFDRSKPTVRITQNVSTFDQAFLLPSLMVDTLNDRPLWGLPPRSIKLSRPTWERKFYGQCYVYYRRTLEFEVSVTTDGAGTILPGWDRNVLDEGTMLLGGPGSSWNVADSMWLPSTIPGYATTPNPDPDNPDHFTRAIDRQGNPKVTVLNGRGIPAGSVTSPVSLTTVLHQQGMVTTGSLSAPATCTVLNTSGGTDTWTYVVTALNEAGETTGTTGTTTVAGTSLIVFPNRISWDFVSGATRYNVYRTVAPGGQPTGLLGTFLGTSCLDNGSAVNTASTPPGSNTALISAPLTPDAQPPSPSKLRLTFVKTGASPDLPSGIIEISGLNERNASLLWTLDFTRLLRAPVLTTIGQTAITDTPQFWKTITNVSFRGLFNTGSIEVKIQTLLEIAQQASIHVEGYNESDFTLLGIPLVF